MDSNQGYNLYKWVICPLTRVINLHPEPLSNGLSPPPVGIGIAKNSRTQKRGCLFPLPWQIAITIIPYISWFDGWANYYDS